MKYLNYFESVEYGKIDTSDQFIDIVTRDNRHEYEYCDGVLYELGNNDNDKIVYIKEVENTLENTFYSEQIDRYVQYIEDGGILQSFPVKASNKADNLEEMLNWLDDEEDGFDIVYSLFEKSEKMYKIYMKTGGFHNIIIDPYEYGFDMSIEELNEITSVGDLKDFYDKENKNYDKKILEGLEKIIKYFNEEVEYTLTDFNHRLEALKKLGKERVYVEVY